jgi:hypothetical protein
MNKTKIDPERVADAIAHHYIETGEAIFGIDLAEKLGVSRSRLDQYIEISAIADIKMKVNPDTASQRLRKSRAYLPKLRDLRRYILRQKEEVIQDLMNEVDKSDDRVALPIWRVVNQLRDKPEN